MSQAIPRLLSCGPRLAWLLACSLLLVLGCNNSKPDGQPQRVVLYCAQDEEFATDILNEFTRRTGIEVAAKFDTEADKSLSLYQELVREARRPRCDVHWNNEPLWTIRLQREGLLEPYASPSAEPYPDSAKDKEHTWHAFATRARVLLVNTDLLPEASWPRSLLDLIEPRFKDKLIMAKPQFGSTSTQAACLFEVLGEAEARRFYLGLRQNRVHIVQGNKHVAQAVGQGHFAVGLTDTDDAIGEVKAGRHVAIIFPDREGHKEYPRLGTLFFPNTVALVRGSPKPDAGRQLIDYLLSAEVEASLAKSASHQIPLNPKVEAQLPAQIATPQTAQPMQVDFHKAADLFDRVQTFLANEFARP